jgi:N-acetylmuramoyl-L-alanine amidase
MFDMASNTKMLATNYAIMHLVGQGLIKDLLTHTAGYAPNVEFYNPALVSPDLYSQDKHKTEEILEIKLGFQRSKGGEPVYSDIDFMLLGLVVKHIMECQLINI